MVPLIERVQASLLGVRIGDALGMPVETMNPQQILHSTGGKGITDFVDAIQKKITSQSHLQAGDATDDWQLTKVVAESLINRKKYDHGDMARCHIQAAKESTIGWGGTTRNSINELSRYFSGVAGSRSPWEIAVPEPMSGAGNGVAMKIAPLALAIHVYEKKHVSSFYSRTPFALAKYTELLWRLTHSHVDALHTAYAIGAAISYCMHHPISDQAGAVELIHWLQKELQSISGIDHWQNPAEIVRRLMNIEQHLGDPVALAQNNWPGWVAIDSVPYALGVFLSFPTDGKTALLTCVNSGIDSDTTAAICGSLIGANCGFEGFPKEWRNFRPDFTEPVELGTQLYQTFSN